MNSGSPRAWVPSSLATAWDRASTRERRVVVIGVAALALIAGWGLVWQPLRADIERTREEVVRNRNALANARKLVDETASLARDAKAKSSADPVASIARVLAERDLRPSGRLELRDDRVKVVLTEARFDRIVAALEALRKEEGLRAVEAAIIARVEPGTVRAELTIAK
jgi:type II secretory pathway component PulM